MDIIDFIQSNGVGIAIILLIPLLVLLIFVIGAGYGSLYITSQLKHTPMATYCASIPHGVYTIIPYISMISAGALATIPGGCIGQGVAPISVLFWYAELLPIGIIAEFVRERVTNP